MMIYKNRIKELREQNDVTQLEVANYVGCSTYNLSRYERGIRKADYEYLILLSQYFNVTINYILCDDRFGG